MKCFASVIFTVSIVQIYGLPQYNQRPFSNILNSNSTVGSFGNAGSNATAQGSGSTVGISGIVTGDSTTSMGVSSSPSSEPSSFINSQANCSDFSTSNASGSVDAEAVASGGCHTDLDNSGNYQITNKMDNAGSDGPVGAVTNLGVSESLQTNIQEAHIAQGSQNPSLDSGEAYQYFAGPDAAIQFSGMMANAQASNNIGSVLVPQTVVVAPLDEASKKQ